MQIEEIKKKVVPVLREAGVIRSSIFGSYARGEQSDKSDIDMLVEVPKGTGLFTFIGLNHKLEDVLNKKVDLGTYNSLHPMLRDEVLKEQISIL